VFLVGVGSGLVLTLAGVFKVRIITLCCAEWRLILLQDILLITGSVLIFGSQITSLQVFGRCPAGGTEMHILTYLRIYIGYSIALAGLVLFKMSGGK
jgi:hypothetical protein